MTRSLMYVFVPAGVVVTVLAGWLFLQVQQACKLEREVLKDAFQNAKEGSGREFDRLFPMWNAWLTSVRDMAALALKAVVALVLAGVVAETISLLLR